LRAGRGCGGRPPPPPGSRRGFPRPRSSR
jgi:hypothetical protein